MFVTPQQVRSRRFRSQLHGYNKRQVDRFLHKVAEDYAAVVASEAARGGLKKEVELLLLQAQESIRSLRRAADVERDATTDRSGGARLLSKAADTLDRAADLLEKANECLVRQEGTIGRRRAREERRPVGAA
jgi:DivIVA domain-containing protein